MAISRAQLVKELEPGLNALFGMEYDRYDQEHLEIYETENSTEEETSVAPQWPSLPSSSTPLANP